MSTQPCRFHTAEQTNRQRLNSKARENGKKQDGGASLVERDRGANERIVSQTEGLTPKKAREERGGFDIHLLLARTGFCLSKRGSRVALKLSPARLHGRPLTPWIFFLLFFSLFLFEGGRGRGGG